MKDYAITFVDGVGNRWYFSHFGAFGLPTFVGKKTAKKEAMLFDSTREARAWVKGMLDTRTKYEIKAI